MARLLFGLGIALVVFTIYAIVDCALRERDRIRGLARGWWLLIILLIPLIGGVLWFVIGRGRAGSAWRSVAPDDDPDFLGSLKRDAAQEERIRRLEQELADLDADTPQRGEQPDPKRHDGDKPGRTDA